MKPQQIVGLVPAAGHATRLQPLPCSKEIYPVGRWYPPGADGPRPRVAIHFLLDGMRQAGADRAFVILREGKWDVPAYLRDGGMVSMHLAYLIARASFGVPYTLDQAYPHVRDALVLMGLPDLLIRPHSAFGELRDRQARSGADVVLGLFRARAPETADMVEVDGTSRIRSVTVKPATTTLELAWLMAAWTPVFTEYLHGFVRHDEASRSATSGNGEVEELWLGDVLSAGLSDGLSMEGVVFPDGSYVDLGDPEDLTNLAGAWREPEPSPPALTTS